MQLGALNRSYSIPHKLTTCTRHNVGSAVLNCDMRCTGGIIGSIGRQVVWNRRTRGTWNCFVLIACKIYLSVTCVFKRYGNGEFSRHGYKLLIYNLILLAIYLKKIKFSSYMLTLNNKEIRHLNLNDISSIWSNEDQR